MDSQQGFFYRESSTELFRNSSRYSLKKILQGLFRNFFPDSFKRFFKDFFFKSYISCFRNSAMFLRSSIKIFLIQKFLQRFFFWKFTPQDSPQFLQTIFQRYIQVFFRYSFRNILSRNFIKYPLKKRCMNFFRNTTRIFFQKKKVRGFLQKFL